MGEDLSQAGVEALPVTDQSMVEVAAVLRASGYKAVTAYVQEAKIRHIKAGYVWGNKLNMLFGDVKRAAKRAQGPAARAEDVRLEWWAMLVHRFGEHPRIQCNEKEPAGGALVWILATRFVLRETELAGLTVDTNGLKLDLRGQSSDQPPFACAEDRPRSERCLESSPVPMPERGARHMSISRGKEAG